MRIQAEWTKEHPVADSVDILRELARPHAAKSGPYKGLLEWCLKASSGVFGLKMLCELGIDYTGAAGVMTPEEVYHARQTLAFFSKLEEADIGVDKAETAMQSFHEAEEACRKTNETFRAVARGEERFSPRVASAIFVAQRKIATVLGTVPDFHRLGYRFGPGATTLTKKRNASARAKLAAGFSCSEELYPAARGLLRQFPHWVKAHSVMTARGKDGTVWLGVDIAIQDGNLEFASKNAKTYRVTVTEPPLNTLVQLAYQDEIAARLRAFGVDLRDQTRNQRLARQGSIDGKIATIDLTSASDMEAKELVYHLLPLDWSSALGRARTGHIRLPDGSRMTLEKFSSMGNGYTFPLESLIFWALAGAVAGYENTSVFGDDIIVPTESYDDVIALLTAVGFKPNSKKSFSTGPFRESCGADWFRGSDVRPYYQKKLVSNRTLFTLHNFYVRRHRLEEAESVLKYMDANSLLWGPDGYGDGHLVAPSHKEFARKRTPAQDSKGYGGYFFSSYQLVPRRDTTASVGDEVLPHYSIYRRGAVRLVDLERPAKAAAKIADDILSAVPLNDDGAMLWSYLRNEPIEVVPPVRWERLRFLRLFNRGRVGGNPVHGSTEETLELPDCKTESGDFIKAVSLPLREKGDAYRKIRIYSLG